MASREGAVMKVIYVARDKDGWWRESLQRMNCSRVFEEWRRGNSFKDNNQEGLESLFPFIKPGEQWRREYQGKHCVGWYWSTKPRRLRYEIIPLPDGESFDVYLWRRIATLDDKPEELWASMDEGGRKDLFSSSNKPFWRASYAHWITAKDYCNADIASDTDDDVPGLQPGMLCKVKKVGEHEYKIISAEECHLPIETEWWTKPGYKLSPYLPGTTVPIICPFETKLCTVIEEKKEEKCQPNYCPQCRCDTQPSDNFCRNCGAPLKEDC